ncbi:MAG: LacI family DNA-binding transcriptional regulator [Phycisphaerae bacterium]|nr:LacI family DNA-binding transcriptional regulator [Phycisphaerae bacterium]
MGKITIEDISRETELSRGTVSRALNDRPDISTKTKQRVLEACRKLNYVPSHAARSLATGRCYAVAVVVDDLRSAFAGCFLRGVLARARDERYAVHAFELGADPQTAVEHLCTVASERVDSVLLATSLPTDLARQLTAAMEARPLVTCDLIEGIACDTFAPDHVEAGRLAARHIIQDDIADIVYVHETGSATASKCLAGFHEICRERGLAPDQLTIEVAASGTDRLEPVRDRLAEARAVAASNDYLAIDLMLLCCEMGRIPARDIAIIGQGNELVGTCISPTLTTVDLCGEEIGRRAMDLAVQRISKTRQDAPQHIQVPPLLIVRESTRCA